MVSLICIIIIMVVFYYFNNVLGTRTGAERPPYDPYSIEKRPQPDQDDYSTKDSESSLEEELTPQEHQQAIEQAAGSDKALEASLKAISERDPLFNIKNFQKGARLAYEMILTAFSKGDKSSLAPLLDEQIYQDFVQAIDKREASGETIQFTFVGVNRLDIVAASLDNNEARLTLKFKSEIISATYDAQGKLVEGDAESLTFIEDCWMFGRQIDSEDLNWKLMSTQANEEESYIK